MHPVQRLYGTAKPAEIRYEVGGRLVDAGVALAVEDTTRQFDSLPERADGCGSIGGPSRGRSKAACCRNGASWPWGPARDVSTSAARRPLEPTMPSAPSTSSPMPGRGFPMPYLNPAKNIEPRLRSFKYLGGNRVGANLRVDRKRYAADRLPLLRPRGIEERRDARGSSSSRTIGCPSRPTNGTKARRSSTGPTWLASQPTNLSTIWPSDYIRDRRVLLVGKEDGHDRMLIARLNLKRQGDKITDITAEKIKPEPKSKSGKIDFTARLNPPGTWIDFGPVATDGAVKINRGAGQLVLFPYPRDKAFQVKLDLKALAPAADLSAVKVHALAAGTCKDLGPGDFRVEDGRLVLTVGKPGAGRYVIAWK